MIILVDTNVLLREKQQGSPQHSIARNALLQLTLRGHELVVTPQILAEFWNVCTRPQKYNGLGMGHGEMVRIIEALERSFGLRRDKPNAYDCWKTLVQTYQVEGVQVHDARLVAAMMAHEIPQILTFNYKDFKRYREISVILPQEVSGDRNR